MLSCPHPTAVCGSLRYLCPFSSSAQAFRSPSPGVQPSSRTLIPGAGKSRARTGPSLAGPGGRMPGARRAVRRRSPVRWRAPGLSPLTQRKRCPYMGRFCPVTRRRSPGRFRESPPPLCPARPRRPEGGRDFPRRVAAWARKAPGLSPERPRWAGRALGSREPPQSLPFLAGTQAPPHPRCLTRPGRGVAVFRLSVLPRSPSPPPGRAVPVCQFPSRCQAGSGVTARSGPAGAAAQAARRSRRPRSGLPPPQLGWV